MSKDKIKSLGKSDLANYIKLESQNVSSVATHKTNTLKSSSTGPIFSKTKFAIWMNESHCNDLFQDTLNISYVFKVIGSDTVNKNAAQSKDELTLTSGRSSCGYLEKSSGAAGGAQAQLL